jgi:uncharacterized protein (TIGR04222 family)
MNARDATTLLQQRLVAWPLGDADAPHAFEDRLADEQGWTRGLASRVVAEYRRFLLMTQCAGHPVTPSREVDAAWHLHLSCSRNYRSMCVQLFGRFLHHDPSKGAEELQRFQDQYAQTLASYARLFGEAPPQDIWPPVVQRFAVEEVPDPPPGLHLPPHWQPQGTPAFLAAMAAIALGAWAAHRGWTPWPQTMAVGTSLMLYGSALVVTGLVSMAFRQQRPAPPGRPPCPDAYEVAWLVGGPARLAATATAALVDKGLLALDAQRNDQQKIEGARMVRTEALPDAARLHPAELALAQLPAGELSDGERSRALGRVAQAVERRLRRSGLLADPTWLGADRLLLSGMSWLLLVLGTQRLLQGVSGQMPSLLVLLLIGLNIMHLRRLMAPDAVTPTARAALRRATESAATERAASAGLPQGRWAAGALALAFALEGTQAVIDDPRFAGINFAIPQDDPQRHASSGSAAGCDAGAGCGGCGGCGG